MKDLGPGTATDINQRGDVAGWVFGSGARAFAWSDGVRTDLATIAAAYGGTFAFAVNERGDIVGRGSTRQALVWSPHG
jgi:probable HAF family extracellular repeat protein